MMITENIFKQTALSNAVHTWTHYSASFISQKNWFCLL